ncbi:MAG: metal-dependent transcriptional regulator [Candidatus Nanopelagicales bacterium]
MSDLIDTTEMYLRTIFELTEEGVLPMRARIAERLGQSGPTVSQTVARMQRDGLVKLDQDDRHLVLTSRGAQRATRVMRKHRLAERLLVDVIGLPWESVHTEACRWEHVMSEAVERRLLEILGHPRESPFGNPIPGLAELGDSDRSTGRHPGKSLAALAVDEEPREVTILRIGESLQSEASTMASLAGAGATPGLPVQVVRDGAWIRVHGQQGSAELTQSEATRVMAKA